MRSDRRVLAKSNKRRATQQSLNGAVKQICDIMRRSNCAGALQYVPELTWILFLRILDEREEHEAEHAAAVGARDEDNRTPEELIEFIEQKGREVAAALAELRTLTGPAAASGAETARP